MGTLRKQYFLRGKAIAGRPLELGIEPFGPHMKSLILHGLAIPHVKHAKLNPRSPTALLVNGVL